MKRKGDNTLLEVINKHLILQPRMGGCKKHLSNLWIKKIIYPSKHNQSQAVLVIQYIFILELLLHLQIVN